MCLFKYIVVWLTFLVIAIPVAAQHQGDCVDARELKLTLKNRIFQVETPPNGPGDSNEISAPRGDKYFFRREHHTHWYTFTTPFSGMLALEITPVDPADDYDFLLFKGTQDEICENLTNDEITPIRSVISRNDTSQASKTGLSAYAQVTHQQEGPGVSYSQAIEVKKGETYYLVLDNVYGGGDGYTLAFQFYFLPRLFGQVVDAETRQPLPAKVYVETHEEGMAIDSIGTDSASGKYISRKPMEFQKDYKLVFFSEGYFMGFSKVNFPILKANRNKPINMALTKMEEGINLTLQNINFNPGVATFLPSALPNLRETLYLMQRYPTLTVELEGHVNGVGIPNCENDAHSNQLAIDRAEAVRTYLIKNGIAPDRMTVKGYGCTKMLFPMPSATKLQMVKNRRVELKVVGM